MASVLALFSRRDVDAEGNQCTKETCPVSDSIYGYAPSLAAEIVFLVLFSLALAAHLIQGWRYKTWSFLVVMTIGNACEIGGYAGRIMLSHDPFSDPGFKLQIVLLTFAPAFYAAGIYFTLKHLVIIFGADLSRLRPAWYTYIFIACDLFSIALQGAGGGIASGADDNDNATLKAGSDVMEAGVAFQVFTLLLFGALCLEYFWRVRKNGGSSNAASVQLRSSRRFKAFLWALIISFTAILIRCIYRVVELAGGWGNSIQQNEASFIVLDSVMCVIATVVLSVFHPGLCFNYKALAESEKETPIGSDSEVPVTSMKQTNV